jgi:peptidoglycan-associated lipoprotein
MTDRTIPARATWPILGMLAVIAGCQAPSKVTQPNPGPAAAAPITTAAPAGTSAATPAAGSAAPQSAVSTVDLASTRSAAAVAGTAALAAPTQRIVYFDFDSFAIKDDFRPMLEGHARVLARDNGRRLVIEGHTDERGGREYNLALGQKRAESVVRSLTLLGVADRQLEAVSFGEERPATAGSTETAWAQNRRAELKDR